MTAISYYSTSHGAVSSCSNEQLTANACYDCIKKQFTRKYFFFKNQGRIPSVETFFEIYR